MKLTYALPLPHNIMTIVNIETSKYSLLAASSVKLNNAVKDIKPKD